MSDDATMPARVAALVEKARQRRGRAPCTFRQTDITRALKAARAAGFENVRVEVDTDGRIVVVVGKVGVEFMTARNGETSEDVKKLI